jgi:hypothetical protein
MENFIKSVEKLASAVKSAKLQKIDLLKVEKTKSLTDYKALKDNYVLKSIQQGIESVKKCLPELDPISYTEINKPHVQKIQNIVRGMLPDIAKLDESTEQVLKLIKKLDFPKPAEKLNFKVTKIPLDIRSDISADIQEMEKCFATGCYRSATILCGRILETALHRKYFETTGLDVLEKNPGIGLGTLIAKLREKNVQFDPGLTEQIHLINQVRVFSVHTKKEAFYPSKMQTHAIILFTMDVLEKLF